MYANGGWIPVDGALSLLCQQLPPEGATRILFWVTSGLMVKPSSSTSGQVWGWGQASIALGSPGPNLPSHPATPASHLWALAQIKKEPQWQ